MAHTVTNRTLLRHLLDNIASWELLLVRQQTLNVMELFWNFCMSRDYAPTWAKVHYW